MPKNLTKSWKVVLNSFWEIFRDFDFSQNGEVNSRNRYFIYYTCWFYQNYIIFEGFVLFWMIAYSFLANFTVKPGFLLIFLNLLLWIYLNNHGCFYGNRCKFYICPWCGKFKVLSKYIHFCTSISYIRKGMNSFINFANLIWLPKG